MCDLRPIAHAPVTVLKDLQKELYLACDSVTTIVDLKKIAEAHLGVSVSTQDVEDSLQPILTSGLMVSENNTYLSLAIRAGVYSS